MYTDYVEEIESGVVVNKRVRHQLFFFSLFFVTTYARIFVLEMKNTL